jgi:uncharacterized protein YjaG (DUF416 family)
MNVTVLFLCCDWMWKNSTRFTNKKEKNKTEYYKKSLNLITKMIIAPNEPVSSHLAE